ncbi:hypothetical protein BDP27DRAFT_1357777 [Rhodocollybia butyracea]|uniref:Uncharacterized protein n=1 Tax=Rhodocollybia butyracea TaxID=206335 RepID=A0A9P5Q991_9AGAR|nr:hypothetical protein BDP27DRAFT_1357777 [Rhodocollybia butyracea]
MDQARMSCPLKKFQPSKNITQLNHTVKPYSDCKWGESGFEPKTPCKGMGCMSAYPKQELELELITRPIQPQLKAVPRRELAGPYASAGSELDSRGEGRLQGQRTDVSKASLMEHIFPITKKRESARVKPDPHAGVTALWP